MRKKAIAISRGVIRKEPNYVFYWLHFMRGLAYGLVSPIYAVLLFSSGLDAFQVGLINLIFILTNLFFQLPAGALADSWGRKKAFLTSSFFNSLAFFAYAFGRRWPIFALAEFFSGLGYVLMMGILEAWAVDAWKGRLNSHQRSEAEYGFLFSRAETALCSASMVGGLMGGILGSISLHLPFFAGGLIFLLIFIMAYILIEEKVPEGKVKLKIIMKKSVRIAKEGTKEGFKNRRIWQVALFAGMAMIAFKVVDMFWAKRFVDLFQGRVWITGYMWPLMTFFMIIGVSLLKWWTDRKKDYLKGFMFVSLWAGATVFLSSIFKNFYPAVFFFFLYELSRGIQRPALFSYFNKIIPSKKRATILSFTITVVWLGGAIGLLTLGWIAKKFSIETAWLGASGVFLLSLAPILYLRRRN